MSADPRGKFWWEEAQWSWPVFITTCSSANLQTSDHVSILSASILGEDGSSCVRRLPEPWPSLASTWKSSETNTLTDSARFCFLWVYVLGPRRSEREAVLLSWGWGGESPTCPVVAMVSEGGTIRIYWKMGWRLFPLTRLSSVSFLYPPCLIQPSIFSRLISLKFRSLET